MQHADRRWWIAPVFVGGYLVVSLGAVVLQLVAAAAWLVEGLQSSPTPDRAAGLVGLLGPTSLAVMTAWQFATMVGLALACAPWLPTRAELAGGLRATGLARVVDALGFAGRSPASWWFAAVGLGLTVGWFPSYVVGRIAELTGQGVALAPLMIEAAATPWQSLPLWVVIGLVGPVAEELVFRGLLWSALDRSLGPVGVIGWSSLVFAAYHMDPMQCLAVLPVGLVLGGLRWGSGSIGPPIAFHIVHNSLAVLAVIGGWGDDVGAVVACAMLLPALASAWAGWRFAR